ncbi:uracil-DNA glycosylase family protein [Rhodoblastus sp.]|uniref:uracil-DNA glycosylase family protein n=1 Tax=Rhodoblastus sp. TaxID=1962975 RepID=UPI003F981F0A
MDALTAYAEKIRACRLCVEAPNGQPLPHQPRPVLRVSATARLLIAGQAPGVRVHASGLPFDDPSGDRLRLWMGIDRAQFYDEAKIAIAPMGFCFPGNDAKGGDLPPRRECRERWHDGLFALMPQIRIILAVGRPAQNYHCARLGRPLPKKLPLDEIVRLLATPDASTPRILALPHPSWRNSGWLKRHPWFEDEIVPMLRALVAETLGDERIGKKYQD